jgi:hypothetical protein
MIRYAVRRHRAQPAHADRHPIHRLSSPLGVPQNPPYRSGCRNDHRTISTTGDPLHLVQTRSRGLVWDNRCQLGTCLATGLWQILVATGIACRVPSIRPRHSVSARNNTNSGAALGLRRCQLRTRALRTDNFWHAAVFSAIVNRGDRPALPRRRQSPGN